MENTVGLPFIAMVAVQFAQIGITTLSKAAMTSGLNRYVFIVYYDSLAVFILLPYFLWRSLRGKTLPITFPLLCRIFGLSLIGKCLFPIFFFGGLNYSSIAFGAALENLCPVFTFLLAISFRIERIDLSKLHDQIKALGTIVAVLGALIMTLYKGPVLLTPQHSSNSLPHTLRSKQANWLLGCLLLIIGFLFRSLWTIFQADTVSSYPDEVSIVFFYTLFAAIQTAAASLFLVKDKSSWKLHHKIDVVSVLYTACLISGFTSTIETWCLRIKGPIYMSLFSALKVALAGVVGFVFLHDGIYLGSVIGSATIVVGFYAVMWAQTKTKTELVSKICRLESGSSEVTPLLKSSSS